MANLAEIKSKEAFEERYLPSLAQAKKAIKMTKRQFWPWYLDLPEKERDRLRKEMIAEAQRAESRASHIYRLLGYIK